jgi:hypothetical protein
MDPNGGVNPSNPRLDGLVTGQNSQLQQQAGSQGPNQSPYAPQQAYQGVAAPTLEDTNYSQMNMNPANIADPMVANQMLDTGPKKNMLKILLVVLGGLVLVSSLLAGGYFIGLTAGKSKGRAEADAQYQQQLAASQQADAEGSKNDADTAELKLGDLKEPEYKDETIEGTVGKQVSTSDGLVLKVTNIERNFKTDDENYKLDPAKELVKVNFLLGNITKEKAKDIASSSFKIENSLKAQLLPSNVQGYEDKFDSKKLDPGSQSKGSIVYEVNKDEKPLNFVREQRYLISGQNREVTTRIIIELSK